MPSAAAVAWIAALPAFSERPLPPAAADLEAWQAWQVRAEKQGQLRSAAVIKALAATNAITVEPMDEAGAAIRIIPAIHNMNGLKLVFLHGGGFTAFSAASTLFAAAPLASRLGVDVISIDYPKAPFSTCLEIVETTCARLLPHLNNRTILVGDSAGGGLALATIQRLKTQGSQLPAALILWSPWVDMTANDPSADDPVLRYKDDLEICAACYTGTMPHNDPIASPLMGTFGPWHPPTLIQAGEREIFLPSLRRLMTKMTAAGADCSLQVTEGLFHSFVALAHELPESGKAIANMRRFIDDVIRSHG